MENRKVRLLYRTPQLRKYGSLRNLTGGSGNRGRDGNLTFTKN